MIYQNIYYWQSKSVIRMQNSSRLPEIEIPILMLEHAEFTGENFQKRST